MTPFRDLPIRHKLMLLTLISSAVALIVADGGFLTWDAFRFRSEVRQEVAAQSRVLAENSAAPLAFGDAQAAGETLAVLELRPRVVMACLYAIDGRLFATHHRDTGTACPDGPPPSSASWSEVRAVTTVTAAGAPVGTLYILRDLSDLWNRLTYGLAAMLGLLLIAAGAAFLIGARIQRSIASPLLELAAAASATTDQPGYYRVNAPASRDEIGVVISTFNRLVDRVEAHTNELSRANASLQNANRLKDEFLATLSHELRTPLNAVLGWTRVLRATKVDAATQERALESIERNAQLQTRLIEDLLEISRIVTGKLRLQVRPVDLAAVVDAAVDVVQPAALAKRLRLEKRVDVRPAMTHGDPDRLQQVIWNLLSNAVKFTPADGAVRITLSGGTGYTITVADTGIGIDPPFLPHLFEAFRQADGTPSREHGGLGLGLAIARQLVELHGGTITAQSEGAGSGATFVVTLPSILDAPAPRPAVRPDASLFAPGAAAAAAQPLLEGLSVLVVDDDRDARALLATTLAQRGAAVTTAEGATDAIDALDRSVPSVIVSDIGMPGEDGYAMIARIRERGATGGGQTPAIALTAYASARDRDAALAAGFQAHMTKPFDPDALAALVARLGKR